MSLSEQRGGGGRGVLPRGGGGGNGQRHGAGLLLHPEWWDVVGDITPSKVSPVLFV